MATQWEKKKVKLAEINTKGNTQPRVVMDKGVISEYQEQMEEGAEFPRPKLFYDGKNYWLADGFHRIRAAEQIGFRDMDADVAPGDRRDAQFYAAGANHDHGLQRKPEDRRKAALTLLTDDEWKAMSDRKIAEHCHVSNTFVGTLRKELTAKGIEQPSKRKTATGGTMKTGKIGSKTKEKAEAKKAPPEEEVAEEPPVPATTRKEKETVSAALTEKAEENPTQVLAVYRTFKVLSELLAIPDQMKLPEVGTLISELRSLTKQFTNMEWASKVSGAEKAAITRTTNQIFEWIEQGTPMKVDTPKEEKATKKAYEPSKDATAALEWWKKNVGLPQKRKPDVDYAKAFDMMHTTDKLSWNDIKEILVGYTVCWQPEGYEVHSPLALRQKTTKGDVTKWESIWKAYKKHPKYKPLTAAPKCPKCGDKLKRAEAQKGGRLYLAWFCAKHPVESAPVGEKYVPRILVKK